MTRVGIVGCGRMGQNHLDVIRSLPGLEVVGAADNDAARARAFAERNALPFHAAALGTLIAGARPQVVHVLTPPFSHAALACEALDAGCHVYVEKPMALTSAEAQSMAAAAARAGRVLTVGHNNLFDTVVLEARERLASGRLGALVGVDVYHGTLPGSPPWVAGLPSGPWLNDTTHLLYLAQAFLGPATEVRALGHPARGGAAEMRAVLAHAGGLSTITLSCGAAPFRLRVILYGTRRTLEIELINGTMVESRPLGGHRWLAKGGAALGMARQLVGRACGNAVRVLTGRERAWSSLRTLLEGFYAAVRGNGTSPVPIADALRVAELLEEIRRQLEQAAAGPGSGAAAPTEETRRRATVVAAARRRE
jgi:predicted dehydrogenase